MAEKSSLPLSVYAFDDEAANKKYQDAYNQLISAIDARQEKPAFDPTWLAAAQGFLSPKKTGSFFESLGNVAGNVAKAQEAEQNRAIETAKARLDLAGMGIQQANQQAGMRDYYAGSQPSPQVSQQAGPQASQQAEKQTSPSSGILSSMGFEDQGVQVGPPQPLPTEKQFVGGKVVTGMNAIDARMEYQKLLRDDLKVGPNGTVYQISTGKMFAVEDPTPIEVPLLSLGGEKFSVTKKQANQLNAFTAAGNNQGRIDFENKIRGIGQPPPATSVQSPLQVTPMPAATGVVNAPRVAQITTPRPVEAAPEASVRSALPPPTQAVGMRAPSEIERAKQKEAMLLRIEEERIKAEQKAQQERKEIRPIALEKQETEQEIKARQEIDDNRKEANDTIAYANQFRKYAELPNAKQMFGILNNNELSSGLAKLVTNTVQAGNVKIGMPEIENVMRNANMNDTQQAQYRNFLQLSTQLQLQRAKYMKGSVSNYEQGILGNAGIGPEDTPTTIRMKADIMASRAQFDRQVAKKFKESKQDAAAFLSSDEYINKMIPDYHDRLTRLIGGETRLQSKPPAQPKTPAQSSTVSRADALAGIR
jgi:hypothetical protein